jgi:sensor histidine kinase YesM
MKFNDLNLADWKDLEIDINLVEKYLFLHIVV